MATFYKSDVSFNSSGEATKVTTFCTSANEHGLNHVDSVFNFKIILCVKEHKVTGF